MKSFALPGKIKWGKCRVHSKYAILSCRAGPMCQKRQKTGHTTHTHVPHNMNTSPTIKRNTLKQQKIACLLESKGCQYPQGVRGTGACWWQHTLMQFWRKNNLRCLSTFKMSMYSALVKILGNDPSIITRWVHKEIYVKGCLQTYC